MKTLLALMIMFMACSIGLISVALVMIIMGVAGAPGAILFAAGQKFKNGFLRILGLLIAALGQSYIVGAYTVFVVGLLRWFSEGWPEVPTWPLWIAAFFHSGAAPSYGMKERPEEPAAQHLTLGVVALTASVIFFVAAFAPQALAALYGWVPYFDSMLK